MIPKFRLKALAGTVFGLCCLVASCASLPPAQNGEGGLSSEQAVAGLEQRRLSVRAFTMSGEINLTGQGGELSGDHHIVAAWPDRLRADITGPFGRRVLTLICDGNRMLVLDYSHGKAYRGLASRANISRFLGISLTPQEVYTLLSGSVPLLKPAAAKLSRSTGQGMMLLRLLHSGAGLVQGIRFGAGDWRITEAWVDEMETGKGNRLTVEFGDFLKTPLGTFPRDFSVKDDQGRRLTLDNQELLVNPAIDGRAFEAQAPAGLTVVELD